MNHSAELLKNPLSFSSHGRFLLKHGMYSAALYYKNRNETEDRRAARAARYCLEHIELPPYTSGQQFAFSFCHPIYTFAPKDDPNGYGLRFNVDGHCHFDADSFKKLHDKCENSVEHYIVDSIIADCQAMYADISGSRYRHGGTHHVPDFEFVITQGIGAYRQRIEDAAASATDPGARMFQEALLDVLEGTETYISRYIAYLESLITQSDAVLIRLVEALKQAPMKPARTFYEAYIACSAAMGLTYCFEPGRIDNYLWPYYEKDLAEGKITYDEAFRLIRAMFEDIEQGMGHPGVTHATIGGTYSDGSPCYNTLTEIAIRAIAGLRTPNVTLRVRRDMPDYIWNAALENIKNGGSHPALVNEELFLEKLTTDYAIPYHDAVNYVFGGCSELLIQGKSMCDSTWVQYNMLDIFENTLYNHFLACEDFDTFYKKVKEDIALTLKELELHINARQLATGMHLPFMMRSLLTDGCIQNGKSYSAGGATYNFDSTNIYAGTNTINSLYTLKQYYEGKLGEFSREEFLTALIANFVGYGELFAKCKKVTKFGNFDPELNALAHDLMTFTFKKAMDLRCWRKNDTYEGRFMPAIILWVDWISSGKRVGATPDGRVLGEATVDSCGPMQGTDTEGPTSVMGAALSLDQGNCAGTCVLNLRLDKANFRSPESTRKVRQLMEVYFRQGGSQLQINVVDPKVLRDAYEHPEKHRDIIVRVGGFSDNFVMLDRTIQQEILKRTEHNI